ncbi:MAG: Ig-like domain-containing protein, partial [Planctomycetota bacterium]
RGLVSWKQLADRAVVTYENVPEYETSNSNTFQVEMYFNGDVRISYLDIDALGGIAGLSEGNGLDPDFYETDLSTMGACGPRPPRALSGEAGTAVDMPVTIALTASDDGLPDPPAELTFIVTSLPGSGELTDPGSGLILGVPHTLAGNGNQAMYQPDAGYAGTDNFQFKANDGGTPPDGGDSNDATMTVTIGGPAWDPLAYDVQASAQISTPKNVPLLASDPNGDPLTYYIQSLPSAGTLSDPGAGAIGTVPYELVGGGDVVTYQPPAGQNLQTLFDFSVRDATAASNVASVTVTVGGPQVVYYFALDSDPGWSTEGDWAFGQPAGAGGANGGPDPTSGHTGNNEYGYNLAGDYANDMPAYYLTTTALDCSGATDVELRFWKWLGVEGFFDDAEFQVSTDGVSWTTIWANLSGIVSDTSWSQMVFDISDMADNEPTVFLRWGMGPTDSSNTYCGWNIDDVGIWAFTAQAPGDCDADGDVDADDFTALFNCLAGPDGGLMQPSCLCFDLDGSGNVDLADFALIQLTYTGSP